MPAKIVEDPDYRTLNKGWSWERFVPCRAGRKDCGNVPNHFSFFGMRRQGVSGIGTHAFLYFPRKQKTIVPELCCSSVVKTREYTARRSGPIREKHWFPDYEDTKRRIPKLL